MFLFLAMIEICVASAVSGSAVKSPHRRYMGNHDVTHNSGRRFRRSWATKQTNARKILFLLPQSFLQMLASQRNHFLKI
jgi:hypothetical protein